jgi:hypothetical protein
MRSSVSFALLSLAGAVCDNAAFNSCWDNVFGSQTELDCQYDVDNNVYDSGCAMRDGSRQGNCFRYATMLYDCGVNSSCIPNQVTGITFDSQQRDTSCGYLQNLEENYRLYEEACPLFLQDQGGMVLAVNPIAGFMNGCNVDACASAPCSFCDVNATCIDKSYPMVDPTAPYTCYCSTGYVNSDSDRLDCLPSSDVFPCASFTVAPTQAPTFPPLLCPASSVANSDTLNIPESVVGESLYVTCNADYCGSGRLTCDPLADNSAGAWSGVQCNPAAYQVLVTATFAQFTASQYVSGDFEQSIAGTPLEGYDFTIQRVFDGSLVIEAMFRFESNEDATNFRLNRPNFVYLNEVSGTITVGDVEPYGGNTDALINAACSVTARVVFGAFLALVALP